MRIAILFGWLLLSFLCLTSCNGSDEGPNHTDGDIDSLETSDSSDSDPADAPETDTDSFVDGDFDTPAERDREDFEGETSSPTDLARVFPINPIATPDLELVTLPEVADDLNGELTAAQDALGIRKWRVTTCVDEGETGLALDNSTQRICTLRQRANKYQNGSFIYEDWDAALAGTYDADDIHPEVMAYYHLSKAYRHMTNPQVGVFDRVPGAHADLDGTAPINVVVNYHNSAPDKLLPIHQAMYIPAEHLSMGMDRMMGLPSNQGEFILLGQGAKADFAYDGETIYHEFGHLLNRRLAGLEFNIRIDNYGLTNQSNALEQGLAETATFLISGRHRLFEYIDQIAGPGFCRDIAENTIFPDNHRGIDQFDGLVVAAANYDAYQLLEQQADLDVYGFTRLFLLTLQAIYDPTSSQSFAEYAQAFLDTLEAEDLGAYKQDIQDLFTQRGLFQAIPAKDLSGHDGSLPDCLLSFGGTLNRMWNVFMTIEDGDLSYPLATAYIQTYLDIPTGCDSLVVSAQIQEATGNSGMYPDPQDWDLRLLLRDDAPILYERQANTHYRITSDREVLPTEPTGPNSNEIAWSIVPPSPGVRLYLHPVNRGEANGLLTHIRVSCQEQR